MKRKQEQIVYIEVKNKRVCPYCYILFDLLHSVPSLSRNY